MPLEFRRSEVCLSGSCTAEEALDLAEWLAKRKRPKANLAECTHMHSALLQTLLAYKPQISAPPADAFLATWVMPALDATFPPPAQTETQ
jgi:hypothetical protein